MADELMDNRIAALEAALVEATELRDALVEALDEAHPTHTNSSICPVCLLLAYANGHESWPMSEDDTEPMKVTRRPVVAQDFDGDYDVPSVAMHPVHDDMDF